MGERIETALPGFVGVREFFRRTGSTFETVPLGDVDAEIFRRGILAIHGTPRDYLEAQVWAWFATAKVREARRYPDGTWLVRFGVKELLNDLSMSKSERQLVLAFDAGANMKFYTLVDGTGLLDDEEKTEFHFSKYDDDDKRPSYRPNGWVRLHQYIQEMDEDEFFVVSDRRYCGMSFFQAIGERHEGELSYLVEYSLGAYVWQFAMERTVSREELDRLVDVFRDGGYPALQDAAKWRRINVEGHWRDYQKSIGIDEWLKAAGMRAEAEGDAVTAEKCLGLCEMIEAGREPLWISVDVGSAESVREQIIRVTSDKDIFTDAERTRAHGFVELCRFNEIPANWDGEHRPHLRWVEGVTTKKGRRKCKK